MPTQCSICLSEYTDPVSIPCGHIYCTKCLADHVNVPTNQAFTSTCPTCRAPFNTVNPDLTYLPRKYHTYVLPSVRRVYPTLTAASDTTHQLHAAETRIAELKAREDQLLLQCERYRNAMLVHRVGERDALLQVGEMKDENKRLEDRVELLEEENEKLEEENDGLVGKCDALERRRNTLEKLAFDLKTMGRELQTGLVNKEKEVTELEIEIKKLKKKNAALKQVKQPPPAPAVENTEPERRIRPLPKRVVRARSDSPPPQTDVRKKPRISEPVVMRWAAVRCHDCGKHHRYRV